MSDTIEAGGKGMVTWLTPYWDAWQEHVGAISGGRLAKALAPARQLLGDERCIAAFRAYCEDQEQRVESPEWFAKQCRTWDKRAEEAAPLVNEWGTLTAHGRKVYGGI